MHPLHQPILAWYDENARELPWRRTSASAWSVVVSEFMLQQTPVSRVLPMHQLWLERWPSPSTLAAEASGEAIRAWGRLGYPRRAMRLHGAARQMVELHDGEVPSTYDELRALPGVGDYTASAILAFAFGRRQPVLDTNVRRVFARALGGVEFPPVAVTPAERDRARGLLPDDEATAATWSVAVMELGALVCTATSAACEVCPVRDDCAWRLAGHPAYDGPPRRGQAWAGTDRQCRGRLVAAVREVEGSVATSRLDLAWPQAEQRQRCLRGLLDEGLLVENASGYAFPG